MVYSIFALAFLSFIVWAHHVFLTGMGTVMSAFFQATILIIFDPIRDRGDVARALAVRRVDSIHHALPMFIQGLADGNRRLWDGGQTHMHALDVIKLNVPMSYAAFALGVSQIFSWRMFSEA